MTKIFQANDPIEWVGKLTAGNDSTFYNIEIQLPDSFKKFEHNATNRHSTSTSISLVSTYDSIMSSFARNHQLRADYVVDILYYLDEHIPKLSVTWNCFNPPDPTNWRIMPPTSLYEVWTLDLSLSPAGYIYGNWRLEFGGEVMDGLVELRPVGEFIKGDTSGDTDDASQDYEVVDNSTDTSRQGFFSQLSSLIW